MLIVVVLMGVVMSLPLTPWEQFSGATGYGTLVVSQDVVHP